MQTPIYYGDLFITQFNKDFIEKFEDAFDLDASEADITHFFEAEKRPYFGFVIIDYLMSTAVFDHVEDHDDRDLLVDSIYIDGYISYYDIDENKLKSEGAKQFLAKFNKINGTSI